MAGTVIPFNSFFGSLQKHLDLTLTMKEVVRVLHVGDIISNFAEAENPSTSVDAPLLRAKP